MPDLEATPLIVAGLAALAVVVMAVGIAMSGRSGISDRLERYASSKPQGGAAAGTGQGGVAELIAQSQALASLNKAVEGRDFWANIARDIARADLHLKPSEFLAIWAASIVGVPLLLLFLSAFVPTLRNPLILLIGIVVGFLLPRIWLARRRNGRLGAFNKQLPDTITLIANALRAGSSFLQAIELVVRETRPPISIEFARVIREVNLGLPFEQA
ncbi:MAG: type II secretion system F family protein, partial [Pseudomonadota bacterium]